MTLYMISQPVFGRRSEVRIWTRGGIPRPEAFVVPDLEGKDCVQGTRSELSRMKPSPGLGLLWLS